MSKTYKFPPLKWLMSFEAAARHMSFTAAAEELGCRKLQSVIRSNALKA